LKSEFRGCGFWQKKINWSLMFGRELETDEDGGAEEASKAFHKRCLP
jgi:hypothetical protein